MKVFSTQIARRGVEEIVKVLTVGGDLVNKGSEAMLLSSYSLLSRHFKNLDLTIASYLHKRVRSKYFGLTIIHNRGLIPKCFLLIKAISAKMMPPIKKMFKDELLKVYENADLIVDVSGFALTDNFGISSISLRCSEILLSKLLDKPFVMFPQSMGPFNSKLSRLLIRSFLPYVDLIFVRGKASLIYLKDLLPKKNINVSPDLAFNLKASSKERALAILRDYNIDIDNKSLIGIMPNMRVYERSFSEKGNNYYKDTLTSIADYIVEEYDANVIFLPHEFREDGYDDREVIRQITNKLERKDRVYAINEELSSPDLKAIIGRMDLLISSRFHGAVAGLSMSVPTMVIGWAHKYRELMEMVNQEEFLVDYQDLGSDYVKEKLTKMWRIKSDIKKILESKVEYLEENSEKSIFLVKDFLKSHHRIYRPWISIHEIKNLLILLLVSFIMYS